MIGGMVSSTVLTLVVIPAIYGLVKGWHLAAAASIPRQSHATVECRAVCDMMPDMMRTWLVAS